MLKEVTKKPLLAECPIRRMRQGDQEVTGSNLVSQSKGTFSKVECPLGFHQYERLQPKNLEI